MQLIAAPGAPAEIPWDRLVELRQTVAADNELLSRRRAAGKTRRDPDEQRQRLEQAGHPFASPAAFAAVFDGFEHEPSGLRTVVPADDPDHDGQKNPHFHREYGFLTAHVDIYDGDQKIGLGNYDLIAHSDGSLSVWICNFRVRQNDAPDPYRYMRQGFGAAFQQHLEQQLAHSGVDRLRLSAVGTGGYVWGRWGFIYDALTTGTAESDIRGAVLRTAADHLRAIDVHAEQLAEQGKIPVFLQQYVAQLAEHGPVPLTPGEFGQIGREHPYTDDDGQLTWLGREVMIMYGYSAVKFL